MPQQIMSTVRQRQGFIDNRPQKIELHALEKEKLQAFDYGCGKQVPY